MENFLVCVEHVSHAFKKNPVLQDVTVNFEKGLFHGIIGNNGSGKTVLFKTICGYLHPQKGRVLVRGKQVGKDFDFPPDMGVLIESPGFLPHEDAFHALSHLWSMQGKPDREAISHVLDMVGLKDVGRKKVSNYSLGMRQRLGIAQAIMRNPSFLILDEPFNGLDKEGVQHIRNILLSLKNQGVTMLLSSHMPEDIECLCDTVHEMDGGKIHKIR